jgi:hypothetical protein
MQLDYIHEFLGTELLTACASSAPYGRAGLSRYVGNKVAIAGRGKGGLTPTC